MKIKKPLTKSFFCAILITFLFFIVFSAQGNDSFNQTMGILIGIPITFICTILYCLTIVFFEQVKIIAPSFIFRFAVPFSFCCVASILICNLNDIPVVDSFQQFSFLEYWQEISIPVLVLFTINMIIAGILSIEQNENK